MALIRDRRLAEDRWRPELAEPAEASLDDIAPGDVVVSPIRWTEERDRLLARDGRIGVRLAPADDVDRLAAESLAGLHLIEIDFPTYTEGRGYSQARRLRGRLRFDGELRACGDVSRDRIAFMERCGFNAFAFPSEESARDALEAFDEIELSYQPPTTSGDFVGALRGYYGGT